MGTPPAKGTNPLMWPLLLSEVFSSLDLNEFPHNWQPQSHPTLGGVLIGPIRIGLGRSFETEAYLWL